MPNGQTTSYASGNAGGIFGPSLFLGAMLVGAIGTVVHSLMPGYGPAPGAYALVGMGVLFANMVRAPLTSVLMIFEMTRDYHHSIERAEGVFTPVSGLAE